MPPMTPEDRPPLSPEVELLCDDWKRRKDVLLIFCVRVARRARSERVADLEAAMTMVLLFIVRRGSVLYGHKGERLKYSRYT